MPCFNLFPPYAGNPHGGHAWVPIDDENCWTFSVDYHPNRPLNDGELQAMHQGAGIHAQLQPGSFTPLAHRGNDYGMDRAAQAAKLTFSGVRGVLDNASKVPGIMAQASHDVCEAWQETSRPKA